MVVQGGVLYSWVYILNPNTSTYLARRWLVFFGGVGLDFYDSSVNYTVYMYSCVMLEATHPTHLSKNSKAQGCRRQLS